jgi:hypothetical protein
MKEGYQGRKDISRKEGRISRKEGRKIDGPDNIFT